MKKPKCPKRGRWKMARVERAKCHECENRWMIDIDTSGEYGCWRLHGCKKPKKQKFSGVANWYGGTPCKDFSPFTECA